MSEEGITVFRRSRDGIPGTHPGGKVGLVGGLALAVAVWLAAPPGGPRPLTAADDTVAQGRAIFRFDTFGDEQLWTGRLRMHEVIESSLDPETALGLGLKVDADALPDKLKRAIQKGKADLTDPAETGMDPAYANRTTTKRYRTTPLRALWQHPPYFHDGSAATLRDVVEHYDAHLGLRLTDRQKRDLVEFLKSI